MRIIGISIYQFSYTLKMGAFTMSRGRSASMQDSTIVRLETDEGLDGWGEMSPFSPSYMGAFGAGARAAIATLAPALIGLDPRQTGLVGVAMDRALPGHYYAKSAIDIACWDVLGHSTGMSVSALLGGRFTNEYPVYTGVSIGEQSAMREQVEAAREAGFRRIQIKVGDDWVVDVQRIEACLSVRGDFEIFTVDANGNWNRHEALSALSAFNGVQMTVEQPCEQIEACARVRDLTGFPMVLDESLDSNNALHRAHTAGALDGANLKLSRVGGITRARRARDLCEQWGTAVTIEDSGGGDIVSAATSHMSASTRPGLMLNAYLPSDMVNESIAKGAPAVVNGMVRVPDGPGLGIEVDREVLGEPLIRVDA